MNRGDHILDSIGGGAPTSRAFNAPDQVKADGSLDTAVGLDGQIAMGGDAGGELCVMQLTGGYLLGTSLYQTTITINSGYAARATGVAFGSDGKIVVGGWTNSAAGHDFVTARVEMTSSFPYLQADSTYGTGGVEVTDLGGDDLAYSMLLEPNGSISLAGSSGSSFGLARFAGVERRLYAQQDANWNITSWVDTSGNVVQRAIYGPYGTKTVLNADWSTLTPLSGVTIDPLHMTYGYQSMRADPVTGLLHSRTRDYDAPLGRWVQQDPTGTQYVNGANLYQMEMDGPVDHVDPSGLSTEYDGAKAGPMPVQQVDWTFAQPTEPGVMSPFDTGTATRPSSQPSTQQSVPGISLTIAFDTSMAPDHDAVMKAIGYMQWACDYCHTQFHFPQVHVNVVWSKARPNAPAGNYTGDSEGDASSSVQDAPRGSTIVIVTKRHLALGLDIAGESSTAGPIFLYYGGAVTSHELAHEYGHHVRYVGDADDKVHCKEPGNIMYFQDVGDVNGLQKPDIQWCERVIAASK